MPMTPEEQWETLTPEERDFVEASERLQGRQLTIYETNLDLYQARAIGNLLTREAQAIVDAAAKSKGRPLTERQITSILVRAYRDGVLQPHPPVLEPRRPARRGL